MVYYLYTKLLINMKIFVYDYTTKIWKCTITFNKLSLINFKFLSVSLKI